MRISLHIVLTLIAIGTSGCGTAPGGPEPQPVNTAAEGVAGIVAHTESAERHVQNATPHADATGKVHLSAASDEHHQVLYKADQTKSALAAAQEQVTDLRSAVAEQRAAYSQLEDRWYVRWGRRIERALWVLGVSWLALGIASIVFGMGNPLSWTWRIGKEITRLIPAMNPFSWVRDWMLSRRREA